MAVRISALGGVAWAAGSTVPAADLNDTFTEVLNRVDTQVDTTEYTEATGGMVLVKTFTFTPTDASTILQNFSLICSIKATAAQTTSLGISINATNLGEYFLVAEAASGLPTWTQEGAAPVELVSTQQTSYQVKLIPVSLGVTGDTSYQIKIWLQTSNPTDNAFLDEQTLRVFYSDGIAEQ